MSIPDAPWIRHAILNGEDAIELPKCPICHQEAERFIIGDGEILGCDNCTEDVDAYDWAGDHWGKDEPDD